VVVLTPAWRRAPRGRTNRNNVASPTRTRARYGGERRSATRASAAFAGTASPRRDVSRPRHECSAVEWPGVRKSGAPGPRVRKMRERRHESANSYEFAALPGRAAGALCINTCISTNSGSSRCGCWHTLANAGVGGRLTRISRIEAASSRVPAPAAGGLSAPDEKYGPLGTPHLQSGRRLINLDVGAVEGETVSGGTFDRSWEQRVYSLRASAGEHEIRFADGVIEVRQADSGLFRARVVWDHGHGERELTTEGPYTKIHAKIGQVLKDGPAFGPTYDASRGIRFVTFESDGSSRATVPEGEVRIKPFLGQFVIIFVPDGGFQALAVAEDPDLLMRAGTDYGADWSTGPRFAVRFAGKHRELRVSNLAHELAFHRLDDDSILSLVPHSLPEDDRPATVALRLVRGDDVQHLAILPALSEEVVIWSDEQTASPGSSAPSAPPSLATTRSAPAASATTLSSGGFASEEVRELVVRYLHHRASVPGPAHYLRQEISPLVLAIERGVDVRGWGHGLVRALERAGDFQLGWHMRTVNYWIKGFKDDGIIARPMAGSRTVEFPFGEFGNLNSIAVARLYAWAGLKRPSAGTLPLTRPPPTAPPPSAPSSGSHVAYPSPSPTSPSAGRLGAFACNADPPSTHPAVPSAPAAAPSATATSAAPTPALTPPPPTPAEPVVGVKDLQWADDREPWPDELKPEFMFYRPPESRASGDYVPGEVDDSVGEPPDDAEDEDIDDAARGPPKE
jgi:hypothetical protein